MCFKLDNGSELFSVQDMHRLRKKSSGVMGSRTWARLAEGASSGTAGDNDSLGEGGPVLAHRHREEKD